METKMSSPHNYDLHLLGWKAFQDLSIAIAEECLNRPIQMFLPSNDAGRDGAFVGTWDGVGPQNGSSTIQCKFTSLQNNNLNLSELSDEFSKVTQLVQQGLAEDYIIITNHPVSGKTEQKIIKAFCSVGVKHCRIFGKDWITSQIQKSPRLRMMVPRLYGLGDLSQILDARAYEQASMILSAMGDDLAKLVVTDAHRKSVHALNGHNIVILLGAPASGKSTIGASLAVGAADLWGSLTIKADSAEDIKNHLNPGEKQFFWIDDAWGATQYQKHTMEEWNKILPLISAASNKKTQFLITSRDYIWEAAKRDIKSQWLQLFHSKVIINVHELNDNERAQILYNHIKLGDQSPAFKSRIKDFLPEISSRTDFLPESARRLGSKFFTSNVMPTRNSVISLFSDPQAFLYGVIRNLEPSLLAAIALVFLNGGRIGSPIEGNQELGAVIDTFGVSKAQIREAFNSLKGSLLLLAQDESSQFWKYKHPTIGDAFAKLTSEDPELTSFYLKGARLEAILREVTCPGIVITGAPVLVQPAFYPLLMSRLQHTHGPAIRSFLSYRANKDFIVYAINFMPSLGDGALTYYSPIEHDVDTSFILKLHSLGILPEKTRTYFYTKCHEAIVDKADSSCLTNINIRCIFTDAEVVNFKNAAKDFVLDELDSHISRLENDWDKMTEPSDHFSAFRDSINFFAKETMSDADMQAIINLAEARIDSAIHDMEYEYEMEEEDSSPILDKAGDSTELDNLFRDVDQ